MEYRTIKINANSDASTALSYISEMLGVSQRVLVEYAIMELERDWDYSAGRFWEHVFHYNNDDEEDC